MTEEFTAPPPLPNFGETNKGGSSEWYYVANGTRQGPTTPTAIKELLSRKQIETHTQVWRKGMPEWKSLRESDLADLVAAEPRAGPGCLDSAPLDLSGFLPGYAERGALRFCRCVGRA
ncbi:hypothetical protein ACVMFA_002232 [Bradyrhizobium liaoningense]